MHIDKVLLLLCIAMLEPGLAHAHSEDEVMSLSSGFMHPILGPDHLLAMLSVGIISALIGGRAIFWVPAAFVCFMVLGATVGVFGIAIPHVETGIAASVLLLGVGIAMPRRFSAVVTMGVVGLFGIMHGNAHGVEMPQSAVPVFYSLGFVTATAAIHILGVVIGSLSLRYQTKRIPMNAAGLAIAAAGVHFFVRAVF